MVKSDDDIVDLSTKNVKSWEDSCKLLRRWRDENIRTSKDILELWDLNVASSINKFGDEKWLVYEQVYIAALDCHNPLVAKDCITALRAQYPDSVRVKKLMAMELEAMEEYNDAIDFYDLLLEEDETNAHIRKRKISCLKAQNRIKEYISELTDYLKTFQADHEAWLELCDAYLNELDYSKAAFCLEELILMYPHNHVYHQRFADVNNFHFLISNFKINLFLPLLIDKIYSRFF
jgi:ER membrane protein complex subunit 2